MSLKIKAPSGAFLLPARRAFLAAAALWLGACGGGTGDRATAKPRLVVFGESHARRWCADNPQTLARWDWANWGVGGETTDRGLRRLPDALALKPDLLVLWQGGNDAIQFDALNEDNYRAMLRLMRDSGVPCLALTIPQIYRDPREQRASIRVAAAQRQLASDESVPLFDVTPLIDRSLILDDGLHLNAAGYALVSKRLGWL